MAVYLYIDSVNVVQNETGDFSVTPTNRKKTFVELFERFLSVRTFITGGKLHPVHNVTITAKRQTSPYMQEEQGHKQLLS